MKMFMMMLASMLVFVGCSDPDEPTVLAEEGQEVASEEAEESNVEISVSGVDSGEEVSTLDVEQEEAEEADATESQVDLNEEVEPPLDEDPTSFEEDPLPDSSFFLPQIP